LATYLSTPAASSPPSPLPPLPSPRPPAERPEMTRDASQDAEELIQTFRLMREGPASQRGTGLPAPRRAPGDTAAEEHPGVLNA
jgi:hypothetical protein